MPHTSAMFLSFQSLQCLIGASWSVVVPNRFTVTHGRRTQPAALVWHKNGHCEVALGGCPVPLRGHSLWRTISWDLQPLKAGGCCAPSPPVPLHHRALSAVDDAHKHMVFYQFLQLGPQRCSGVLGAFTPP